MKTEFLTQFNFSPLTINKEKNNGQRLTVEGQAYTCRELVEKHRVGQMPPVQDNSLRYSGSTIIGNPIDIVEVQNAQLEFEHWKAAAVAATAEEKAEPKAAAVAAEKAEPKPD